MLFLKKKKLLKIKPILLASSVIASNWPVISDIGKFVFVGWVSDLRNRIFQWTNLERFSLDSRYSAIHSRGVKLLSLLLHYGLVTWPSDSKKFLGHFVEPIRLLHFTERLWFPLVYSTERVGPQPVRAVMDYGTHWTGLL